MANVDRFESDARHSPRVGATARRGPAAALAYPQFRLLLIGTTLSMLAFGMMQVVQGVVAFDLTGRNGAVGLVSLGSGIAMLTLSAIFAYPIGSLADWVGERAALATLAGACAIVIAIGALAQRTAPARGAEG